MRGLFVTGTGTGVGKSVVAAAICAALAQRGERVAAFKPAVTGLDDDAGPWGQDHELLASVATAGQRPEEVAPYRFGPLVSPHHAAELAGETIEPARLTAAAREAAEDADALVCEGVGGLMVPLTPGYLVRDLALDLGLPLVVAAGPGLGTINHSVLTVESARAAGLEVHAVVMGPWPEDAPAALRSNRETVERLAGVEVAVVPELRPGDLSAAALPVERWLG